MNFIFTKRHVVGFIILLSLQITAQAQTYLLTGDYHVRSSPDFLSETNKVGFLAKGSTFRVVNSTSIANGAESLEIEVISKVGKSTIKDDYTDDLVHKLYIYKARKPYMTQRSGPGETVEGATQSDCKDCHGAAQQERAVTTNNREALSAVAENVIEAANKAPASNDPPPEPEKPMFGPPKPGSLDEKIRNYSNSTEVSRMIEWAMKNKSAASNGLCYRKAKEAIATQCASPPRAGASCRNIFKPQGGKSGPGNNLTASPSTDLKDFYALSAKERLKEQGFVNLIEMEPYKTEMKSPTDAPKGAILVYSSGVPCSVTKSGKVIARAKDCGHVEIKTGQPGEPGYVSDYYSDNAINETERTKRYPSNYKLVGVMIKPKE